MVRINLSSELIYEVLDVPCDFIINIEAARTPHQTILFEELTVEGAQSMVSDVDPVTANRYLRMRGQRGSLRVRYKARVEIRHQRDDPSLANEVPVAELPFEVLPYVYPSRYCQSDQLGALANAEFGHVPSGYARVCAIQDWVQARTRFASQSSTSSTSATDTVVQRVGVCRDFAHLMIAICRALNMPARFVTSVDYGADPVLGPPDFHAYVEVFLGTRWYLFDASGTAIPEGMIRIGTGRDAADVSFATIFGNVRSAPPVIHVDAESNPSAGLEPPMHRQGPLSTAALVAGSAMRFALHA